MALAEIFLAGLAAHSKAARPTNSSPATTSALTISPKMFQAIRDVVAQEQADVRIDGLAAAVSRHVQQLRGGRQATPPIGAVDAHALLHEFRRSNSDTPTLGLSKALARELIRTVGPERSEIALEACRADITGRPRQSARPVSSARPVGRVLGAAPRR